MKKAEESREEKKDLNFNPKKSKTIESYTVKAGDTLSMIAEKFYGDAAKYTEIFEANKDTLSSADDIKAGQELKIPPKK